MSPTRRYCRCGTLLARDNTASVCSLCQSKRRRDRAPDVPPEFWHTAAMAAALESGDLGQVVRAYRFHPFHGQPLPQCIVAGWLHVGQATLSLIESGQRRLTVDEIAGFARSSGCSAAAAHRSAPSPVPRGSPTARSPRRSCESSCRPR